MFESKGLIKMLGVKSEDVTGGWMKVHEKSFIVVPSSRYFYGNQIKWHEMGRECGTYDGKCQSTQSLIMYLKKDHNFL
jgi:hypothetical protein